MIRTMTICGLSDESQEILGYVAPVICGYSVLDAYVTRVTNAGGQSENEVCLLDYINNILHK